MKSWINLKKKNRNFHNIIDRRTSLDCLRHITGNEPLKRQSQLQQRIFFFLFFFFFFSEKTSFEISCESLADDSHGMSRLVFSEK